MPENINSTKTQPKPNQLIGTHLANKKPLQKIEGVDFYSECD